MSTTKKTILITGANTGIGYALVESLWTSTNPYHIILAGRSPEKVTSAIQQIRSLPSPGSSTVEPLTLDVSSDASIAAAHAAVIATGHTHLDALVNNAGINLDPQVASGALGLREAFAQTWDVNVTGAHLVSEAFAGLLVSSSQTPRLLFLTSGMASLAEERSRTTPAEARRARLGKGWPKVRADGSVAPAGLIGYRASKTGLNMLALHWRDLLEPDGVKVFVISPGFLATNLVGTPDYMKKAGGGDASLGGNFMRDVIEGKRDEDEGYAIRSDSVQPF